MSCLLRWLSTLESNDWRSGFGVLDYALLIHPTRLRERNRGAKSRFSEVCVRLMPGDWFDWMPAP